MGKKIKFGSILTETIAFIKYRFWKILLVELVVLSAIYFVYFDIEFIFYDFYFIKPMILSFEVLYLIISFVIFSIKVNIQVSLIKESLVKYLLFIIFPLSIIIIYTILCNSLDLILIKIDFIQDKITEYISFFGYLILFIVSFILCYITPKFFIISLIESPNKTFRYLFKQAFVLTIKYFVYVFCIIFIVFFVLINSFAIFLDLLFLLDIDPDSPDPESVFWVILMMLFPLPLLFIDYFINCFFYKLYKIVNESTLQDQMQNNKNELIN